MSSLPAIAPAHRDDLPGTLALLRANGLPTEGVDLCLDTALVARLDGRVVGSAALEPYYPDALLRSVAVDAALRGRGLGAALVQQAMALAKHRGVRTVYLLTETAPVFFAKLGFVLVPRADVAAAVRRSVEFTVLCSQGAQAMRRAIEG